MFTARTLEEFVSPIPLLITPPPYGPMPGSNRHQQTTRGKQTGRDEP